MANTLNTGQSIFTEATEDTAYGYYEKLKLLVENNSNNFANDVLTQANVLKGDKTMGTNVHSTMTALAGLQMLHSKVFEDNVTFNNTVNFTDIVASGTFNGNVTGNISGGNLAGTLSVTGDQTFSVSPNETGTLDNVNVTGGSLSVTGDHDFSVNPTQTGTLDNVQIGFNAPVGIKATSMTIDTYNVIHEGHTGWDQLQLDVNGLNTTVDGLQTTVSGLNTTVSDIESDVSGLQSDVGGLNTTVSDVQSEVLGMKSDVSSLMQQILPKELMDFKVHITESVEIDEFLDTNNTSSYKIRVNTIQQQNVKEQEDTSSIDVSEGNHILVSTNPDTDKTGFAVWKVDSLGTETVDGVEIEYAYMSMGTPTHDDTDNNTVIVIKSGKHAGYYVMTDVDENQKFTLNAIDTNNHSVETKINNIIDVLEYLNKSIVMFESGNLTPVVPLIPEKYSF